MTKSVNSYHTINGFVGLDFTLKCLIVSGRLHLQKYTFISMYKQFKVIYNRFKLLEFF